MYRQIEKYQTVQINSWKEGKYDYKLTIKYGMHYLHGDYQPCFAITGSTLRKNSKGGAWVEDSIGCLHDLIQERAKHLSPLIPFHLCDQNGLPMYYLENGYYWYKKNLETFKSYIRLADDETIPEVPKIQLPIVLNDNGTEVDLPEKEKEKIVEKARKQFVTDWLKTREGRLKQEFEEVMKQFSIELITQAEIDTLKAKYKTA